MARHPQKLTANYDHMGRDKARALAVFNLPSDGSSAVLEWRGSLARYSVALVLAVVHLMYVHVLRVRSHEGDKSPDHHAAATLNVALISDRTQSGMKRPRNASVPVREWQVAFVRQR